MRATLHEGVLWIAQAKVQREVDTTRSLVAKLHEVPCECQVLYVVVRFTHCVDALQRCELHSRCKARSDRRVSNLDLGHQFVISSLQHN